MLVISQAKVGPHTSLAGKSRQVPGAHGRRLFNDRTITLTRPLGCSERYRQFTCEDRCTPMRSLIASEQLLIRV